MTSVTGKKVVFIIAPNQFRDEEYFQPKVVLQANGVLVDTAAKGNPEESAGTQGGKARADVSFDDINLEQYDGIVFVGGVGAKVYLKDKKIHKLIRAFNAADKIIGAICFAPAILAAAGILDGKKVTSYPDQKDQIEALGGIWQDKSVVIDDRIVTAKGVEAAILFGENLISVLAK